jgi:hypothetical protein
MSSSRAAVEDLAGSDFLVAQNAGEALIAVGRSVLHDTADQVLAARCRIDRYFEH